MLFGCSEFLLGAGKCLVDLVEPRAVAREKRRVGQNIAQLFDVPLECFHARRNCFERVLFFEREFAFGLGDRRAGSSRGFAFARV